MLCALTMTAAMAITGFGATAGGANLPNYTPIPFDGTVVSAFAGSVKPSAEIFRHLLERFQLKAGECYFVDDMPENVAGAKRSGIDGFVFRGDANALRSALAALGVSL